MYDKLIILYNTIRYDQPKLSPITNRVILALTEMVG
jgi:hypothetical protein